MIIEPVLGLALSIPVDPSLKCPRTEHLPGYPEDSAVIILDGEILGSTADFSGPTVFLNDTIEPSDIARLEHKCWDPETDALPAARGIQLIVIGSFSAQAAAESATLDAARLVHDFVAERGELPATLADVDPSLAGYSIEDAEMGWRITSSDMNGLACSGSQPSSQNNEVRCTFAYSEVKQLLREAWGAESRLPN